MACQFDVLLNAGLPPNGPEAAVEALNMAEYLESILSVYKPESEFSQINRAPQNTPVKVSRSTAELVSAALELQEQTDQAFNISAASLSELWGFSRRAGAMPQRGDIGCAVDAVNSHAISIDPNAQFVVRTREDVRINSGGIGKGYAIDQMATLLISRNVDDFLVHGGHSSILARGDRHDIDAQDGWRIAVRHPDHQQFLLGELRLRNMALGTSGPANQFFYFNGVRYGHIIDPRTGWPASGMLSITVLNPSAMKADALATALFVLGVEQAEAYCQQHPETGFLAILPTKRQGHVEIVRCNIPDSVWTAA
jgi:thiamine biosynthesis lipoprotein